jgi:hypothetical protein
MRNNILAFFFFACGWNFIAAQSLSTHPFLDETMVSWHQFSVEETGVHKISRDFLSKLNLPVEEIDPRTIRIFGRGGQMLPLKLGDEVETLYENALFVKGEEDGSFDDGDFILFMGYANDTWNEESETSLNLYHDTAQYYITYGTSFGKRALVLEGTESPNTDAVTSAVYTAYLEEDNYNLGSLGRRWFGQRFSDEQEETFILETPNVATGTQIDVAARVASDGSTATTFELTVGSDVDIKPMSGSNKTIVGAEPSTRFNQLRGMLHLSQNATESITAKLLYRSNGDLAANGYLDFLMAQYHRNLDGAGESFMFSLASQDPAQQLMVASASSETCIWEMDGDVIHIPPTDATSFGSDVIVNEGSRFYLSTAYKTPFYSNSTRVLNPSSALKDLNALPPTTYLLITAEAFRKEAELLVSHRKNVAGLSAQVVTVEEIYQAFSTGQQDIAAIRNFVRYLYFSQGKKLKYLCLFGDTSYDYKKRYATNDMVVPTFHALNSFSLTNSFMSDDFFVMLDENEGLLTSYDLMDVAVGRMVFSTASQANVLVNKVMDYENPKNKDSWNNSFTILSDDADKSRDKDDFSLQVTLNDLGDEIVRQKPMMNITKIHADAYKQIASAGGDRYPEVETALENRLSQGTLVVNYFGHGGEDGLAQEFIVDKDMASTLFHPGKYPLFITVTCEFSRFDNHTRPTAGEMLYQNPTGGAIGMISTTRQIYINKGIDYNKILSKYLFSYGSEDYTSIAEALRLAKNEFTDANQKRVLFYIGDPALKLHIPKREIAISHLNGVPVADVPVADRQFKALDKITLGGEILGPSGQLQQDFNGTVSLQIFDKEVERSTLGNDQNKTMNFTVLGEQVFEGIATVSNGQFSSTFVIPKDINLDVDAARISFIAFNQDKTASVGGFSNQFNIGGINADAVGDTLGPIVNVYLENRSFVDGGKVFDSPMLIVDFEDENGINSSGGLGHDITATLDDNQVDPYVLNAFYTTALDDFTKGTLTYPLNDLELGLHTLTLRAWDTHNNPSSKTISFTVVDSSKIQIENVFNSPNPVTNQTIFFIQHNKPRELLDVKISIFTIDGKRIWTNSQEVFSSSYLIDSVAWDATTYSGQKVNKGTYIYTIELISTLSNSSDIYSGKLIVK